MKQNTVLALTFLVLSFVVFINAQCHTDVIAGPISFSNGSSSTAYILQAGGTRYGGVSTSGNSVTVRHGSRAYIGSTCAQSYQPNVFEPLYLLDKSLSFTVDLSQVSCGCNAALYLTEMPAYNQNNQPDPTRCGDYYCDANQVCGVFCPEMDIMEANNHAFQITPHKCDAPSGKHYYSCDGGGCGQNLVRNNPQSFGFGSNYIINTQQPVQVSISFQTSGGMLSRIVTDVMQNGRNVQIVHDSSRCGNGYLSSMTDAFRTGMVVIFTFWGSTGSVMSWLDVPPCSINEACNTNAAATFSNIQIK
jgi:cellulose 1,4-beta-cellobiosidase